MQFFDCNVSIGLPVRALLAPVATIDQLLAEMDRAGIDKALVWHVAQHDAAPQTGNRLLTQAISAQPRLLGSWTILPNQTKEFPSPEIFFREMRQSRVVALRAFPRSHHFLLDEVAMGDWLSAMVEYRVPLFLSLIRGTEWQDIYQLLAQYPKLVCVVCDHGSWGMDRNFRPLLERYPNFYIDLSHYMLDGGLESLVAYYGGQRILFGSRFPECYFGGMMLTLKHARIPDEAKDAIASKNMERILAEVKL